MVARTQTLVQLSDILVAALDQRAAQAGRSHSDLVREAVERYLAEDLEAAVDHRYAEAYSGHPPQDDRWVEAAGRRTIAEERW